MAPELSIYDDEPRTEDSRGITDIILESGKQLLESVGEEGLSSSVPLEIDNRPYFLAYTLFPRESGDVWVRVGLFDQAPVTIANTSSFNQGEVAMTRLMFNFHRNIVHGEYATDERNEGRGFGSALLLMRESIIHDVIERYRSRIPSKVLRSEITDTSRAQTSTRHHDGLTSFLAEKMGYHSEGEKLVKDYQVNPE